jgi:uncharacterized protein
MSWLQDVFKTAKPILGMVHLPALPGTPLYDDRAGMQAILRSAHHDLEGLVSGGVDAVIFCNENDRPYQHVMGPEVVAAVTKVVAETTRDLSLPFGIDLLWDPVASIAVAHATGAAFVREVFTGTFVGDMGLWGGEPGRVLRFRRHIGAQDVKLLFNIAPEFSVSLGERPLGVVAHTTVFSSLADALCVSGQTAGTEVSPAWLTEAKSALPHTPVFANTGVRISNLPVMLEVADGAVVGSSFKRDGIVWNPVDAQRVSEFMKVVRELRGAEHSAPS